MPPQRDSDLPDISEISATEALAVVLGEVRRGRKEMAAIVLELCSVREELARLRHAVRRPERVIYRPAEAARRLQIGRTKLYELWNSGALAYNRDRAGRYSTEAQIMAYLRDANFVH